ncbi:hypothetical protein BC827DRAFT_614600 [Russula dissimulans]|nr:hypothetical protein BC827DRAFT_614600 [Russula dissimulans]
MKDYGGISAERLQVLEERLRDDVVSELHASGGKLLLHTETPDGSVIPVWEEVRLGDVAVVKDVIDLITVMLSPYMTHMPIVINDQLGCGRSTLTSIILILLQQWLVFVPSSPRISKRQPSVFGHIDAQPGDPPIR